jgi:putative NIF3 family GTP cyclohydrolase 1 type 2
MHLSDDHRKEAEEHFINVVVAGHMASDTLGMNLLLDEVLEGADEVQILTCSGFQRHARKK